ncbi:hypothetical protein SAMN05444336_102573 [Albimonas donghaensis]|uniref:Uncharacterized protein n=1 Tax=Albimonas donghaensis TaxID=356660 RepID=A0A1H2X1K7_9RHOB|nr:hypothetical protein SAMN05444336_102573 [Albimonas donghaensis]
MAGPDGARSTRLTSARRSAPSALDPSWNRGPGRASTRVPDAQPERAPPAPQAYRPASPGPLGWFTDRPRDVRAATPQVRPRRRGGGWSGSTSRPIRGDPRDLFPWRLGPDPRTPWRNPRAKQAPRNTRPTASEAHVDAFQTRSLKTNGQFQGSTRPARRFARAAASSAPPWERTPVSPQALAWPSALGPGDSRTSWRFSGWRGPVGGSEKWPRVARDTRRGRKAAVGNDAAFTPCPTQRLIRSARLQAQGAASVAPVIGHTIRPGSGGRALTASQFGDCDGPRLRPSPTPQPTRMKPGAADGASPTPRSAGEAAPLGRDLVAGSDAPALRPRSGRRTSPDAQVRHPGTAPPPCADCPEPPTPRRTALLLGRKGTQGGAMPGAQLPREGRPAPPHGASPIRPVRPKTTLRPRPQ